MFLQNKPEWMTEQQWRTARTVLQNVLAVFGATAGVGLLAVLNIYKETHIFNWDMLWFEAVVAGLIAVLTWAMNKN